MLDNHLDVYQCYNNLIRVNSALTIKTEKGEKNIERTPCIVENITDHIWTWEELLMLKTVSTINQDITEKKTPLITLSSLFPIMQPKAKKPVVANLLIHSVVNTPSISAHAKT